MREVKIIFIVLFYSQSSTAKLLPVNVSFSSEQCCPDFFQQYLIYNVNIMIDFNSGLNIALNKPHYKSDLMHFRSCLNYLKTSKETPNSFTFLRPNKEDLEKALLIIKSSKIDYILLHYIVILNNENVLSEIAATLFKYKLYFSVILSKNKIYSINSRNTISHTKYVGMCSQMNLAVIQKIKKYSQIYPKNTTINVIWSKHEPFLIESGDTITGIKIDALKAFSQASPVKLFYRPSNPLYKEEFNVNSTFSLVREALESDYADMYLGATNNEVLDWLCSGPILWMNQMYFFIPNPYGTRYLLIILSMMSPLGWAITLLLFILWVGLFMFLTRHAPNQSFKESFTRSILMFFSFLIGLSYDIKNYKALFAKILIVSYLLMSVQLTTFLQGRLSSRITNEPRVTPIKSLSNLLNLKMPIHLPEFIKYAYSNQYDTDSVNQLLSSYISDNEDMVILATKSLKYRNIITLVDSGYLLMHPKALENHRIFEINVFKQTAATKKNYYLKKHVFDRMQRIIESGIVDKFTKLYKFKYSLLEEQRSNTPNYKITAQQFSGLFLIQDMLFVISIITFFGEILVKKFNIKRLVRFK